MTLQITLDAQLASLKTALLPRDTNDERDVIVEIRAGAGGDEAGLFAADLFRMYSRYALTRGWNVEVIDRNESAIGSIKEIIFEVKGKGAFSPFQIRARRAPRAACTLYRGRRAHPHLDGHGGGVAGSQGCRSGRQSRRPAHRYLPLGRRGRPERQQGVHRGASNASPHRAGGSLPGRALAAAQPTEGHGSIENETAGCRAHQAGERGLR